MVSHCRLQPMLVFGHLDLGRHQLLDLGRGQVVRLEAHLQFLCPHICGTADDLCWDCVKQRQTVGIFRALASPEEGHVVDLSLIHI